MNAITDFGERLAWFAAGREHLATKADLARLELRLTLRIVVILTLVQGFFFVLLKYLP